jgi:hypothetical protein
MLLKKMIEGKEEVVIKLEGSLAVAHLILIGLQCGIYIFSQVETGDIDPKIKENLQSNSDMAASFFVMVVNQCILLRVIHKLEEYGK